MSKFIQLHLLTSYPPSNLNRDDLGRPKTATMGGTERLRVSSQSLKRHWRTSDLFQQALGEHTGIRTKKLGIELFDKLVAADITEKQAKDWAQQIAGVFGKLKKDSVELEQLVHVSQAELNAMNDLVDTLINEKREPEKDELKLLRNDEMAVDIALFGRMLASSPDYNVEAACQVAHAISVHAVTVEDDYFTAVDDLNTAGEQGSAHIGESSFAAALYYLYVCIDKEQLVANLNNDLALANKAIAAFVESAVKVSPTGKQNSFASRAYASYVLAEKGNQQPRSLSVAFLKAIRSQDIATDAINALETQREHFDQVYGACADDCKQINVLTGEGSFNELTAFIAD